MNGDDYYYLLEPLFAFSFDIGSEFPKAVKS